MTVKPLLSTLRSTLNELITTRVRSSFNALADEEVELIVIKNSLDWLLSDLRESRQKLAGSHKSERGGSLTYTEVCMNENCPRGSKPVEIVREPPGSHGQ